MPIHVDQDFMSLVIDMQLDMTSATNLKIHYERPNGTKGEFTPVTVTDTTKLSYAFQPGDPVEAGVWYFSGYGELGGKKTRGKRVPELIEPNLE